MYSIMVPIKEIDKLIDDCTDSENRGHSKFSGMSYEQGIKMGILWVLGEEEHYPLED